MVSAKRKVNQLKGKKELGKKALLKFLYHSQKMPHHLCEEKRQRVLKIWGVGEETFQALRTANAGELGRVMTGV